MAEIKVKATFDGSSVRTGLNQLKGYGKEFSSSLAGGIAGGLGAAAIAGKMIQGFANALEKFATIGDLSERLGVDTTMLQRFGFAAEQTGMDIETAAKALQKIKLSMGDAAAGEKKATDAFSALGISLEDIRRGNPETILFKIADGLSKVGDENQRLNMLTEILGNRLGGQLLPLLGEGSENLRQLMSQAATLSEADVMRLKAADDQIKATNNSLSVAYGWLLGKFGALVDIPAQMYIKKQRSESRNFATDQFNAGMISKDEYNKQLEGINKQFDPLLAQYGDEEAQARQKKRREDAIAELNKRTKEAASKAGGTNKKTAQEIAAESEKKAREKDLAGRVSAFVPVSSSLGAVGGGGGFYTGTDPALAAAQATASATERTANAVEIIAGRDTTDPTSISE
jgi:hypothetical protein